MHFAACCSALVLWLTAAWIVLVERIGDVLFALTASHGIHAGDLLAVPLAAAGAILLLSTGDRRRLALCDRSSPIGARGTLDPVAEEWQTGIVES